MNNQEFIKPDPTVSDCTIPKSEWTIPLPNNKGTIYKIIIYLPLFILNIFLYF